MSIVGFAPVNQNRNPKWGTPPINPDRSEMNRGRDILVDAIKDKAPVIAAILSVPVGCDMPEQGGISGNLNKKPPKYVCYMA